MGMLVEGEWKESDLAAKDDKGNFLRPDSSFREWISKDSEKFQPERNRYHLYVSYACPWAHRTLIMRNLKSLEDVVSVDVVHPFMLDKGWTFERNYSGATGDTCEGFSYLYEVYQQTSPHTTTRVTVPVLWDKKTESIVNNESSEIIRMMNSAFNDITGNVENFYPHELIPEIDRINEVVYHKINNGVYKAGFASSQEAYEQAVEELFSTLNELEELLAVSPYLVGDTLTEADVRLFTTLIRFDLVYHYHFKCNLKKIADYKYLFNYLKSLYEIPQFGNTVHFDHIKDHYYYSQKNVNPYRIIPIGPENSFEA